MSLSSTLPFTNGVNPKTILSTDCFASFMFSRQTRDSSIYFFTIFMYNVFAVLVTFQLSSIWHAILDNFRPITVW